MYTKTKAANIFRTVVRWYPQEGIGCSASAYRKINAAVTAAITGYIGAYSAMHQYRCFADDSRIACGTAQRVTYGYRVGAGTQAVYRAA